MKSKLMKLGGAAAAACAIAVLSATPASAATWNGSINGPGGGAGGSVKLTKESGSTSAVVRVTIIDTKKDGYCAAMRIIFDKPFTDYSYDSPKACGHQVGKTWNKDILYGSNSVRRAKLQMCRVHSDGSGRHCETKAYVENTWA
ncbi:hypothetical protein AB0P36_26315 [Streptomyces flavidovirens]|uniref:hypothetical protein n=1 Tax=Streptomyces flavidovirens TaxID=67298 RepID=UPI0034348B39